MKLLSNDKLRGKIVVVQPHVSVGVPAFSDIDNLGLGLVVLQPEMTCQSLLEGILLFYSLG